MNVANGVSGIIVVAIIIWVVTTFGISIYEVYERSVASPLRLDASDHDSRYAFVPQIIAISVLYGVSASHFDLETPSEGDPRTVAGDRQVIISSLHSCSELLLLHTHVGINSQPQRQYIRLILPLDPHKLTLATPTDFPFSPAASPQQSHTPAAPPTPSSTTQHTPHAP